MAKRRSQGDGSVYKRSSDGRWMGSIDLGYRDGKRYRPSVSGRTEAEVRRKLKALQDTVGRGVYDEKVTVGQWMTYWLEHVAKRRVATSTYRTYENYVANWVTPTLGSKRLAMVKPADVRALHERMREAGKSETTTRQVHAIVHRALKVAVQDQRIPTNPAALVDAPKPSRSRHAALTTSQAVAVLRACESPRELARAFVALTTALRQGEALGLDWADVDLDGGVVRVHQVAQRVKGAGVVILPRTKSGEGEERMVPLIPEAIAALRAWREESGGVGLVFGRGGEPARPEGDNRAWHALCARAEVPSVPLHGARASAGTYYAESGVPPHLIGALMGHHDMAVTLAHYLRSSPDEQRRALAGLRLLSIGAAAPGE